MSAMNPDAPFTSIIVPLDGSPLAEAALPPAVALAARLGARVTLLHVLEADAPATVHGAPHLVSATAADLYLHTVAERWGGRGCELLTHVHPNLAHDVARGIADHTAELGADLIALCTHGSGGVRGFLFGSIAQQVLRLAPRRCCWSSPTTKVGRPRRSTCASSCCRWMARPTRAKRCRWLSHWPPPRRRGYTSHAWFRLSAPCPPRSRRRHSVAGRHQRRARHRAGGRARPVASDSRRTATCSEDHRRGAPRRRGRGARPRRRTCQRRHGGDEHSRPRRARRLSDRQHRRQTALPPGSTNAVVAPALVAASDDVGRRRSERRHALSALQPQIADTAHAFRAHVDPKGSVGYSGILECVQRCYARLLGCAAPHMSGE